MEEETLPFALLPFKALLCLLFALILVLGLLVDLL
jgi:hypothetical protein